MKLETKYHGIIEYKEEDIIIFKKGFPGFEKLKKFILFPLEENEVFSILHSIEDCEIGFVVVSPFDVMKEYEFELDDNKLKELNITNNEQVLVVNTVTLNSNIENITVNLRAPIIINNEENLAQQVILNNDKYLVKHPLIKEEK
jgi:flagellar assembly factor FliW